MDEFNLVWEELRQKHTQALILTEQEMSARLEKYKQQLTIDWETISTSCLAQAIEEGATMNEEHGELVRRRYSREEAEWHHSHWLAELAKVQEHLAFWEQELAWIEREAKNENHTETDA